MALMSVLGFVIWTLLMVLIFRKAGYSGVQILFLFIPGVNIIVFVWFALTEWPIQRELMELKERWAAERARPV